ncbi:Conserved_hypothetical protein [Hexamita inflata]|uniref:Uncharacterized protein n=1 Tax=Hexamita inflata TaxID=28002 RepID=A0AA86TPT5_9EUKA|nr:Conserved hypothetical protein [Hexamita inflata]
MKLNHTIKSKEDLLSHFGSSQKLEILDSEQMKKLLALNVQPKIWEDALNRNLLSFNQELVQETEEFTFNRRNIEYIYLISFLTNLTELNLSENQISDISSISKLKYLKKLNLTRNRIEDISALQSLPDLTHLYLQYNKLTSYTVALPNLVELSLSGDKLQEKSGLQHSPKLERLYLSKTETTDLRSILHQLFGLKVLYLSSNNLKEISYLSTFLDLQILCLCENKYLQNIGPLKFCTQLTYLCFSKTNVADIQFLNLIVERQNISIQFLSSQTQLNQTSPKIKYLIFLAFPSSNTQRNSIQQETVSKIFLHFNLCLIQLTYIYNIINQLPTQQLYRIQLNYHSAVTSYKKNLGYNILLNQRDYICLKQKPQIYVLFFISYSV